MCVRARARVRREPRGRLRSSTTQCVHKHNVLPAPRRGWHWILTGEGERGAEEENVRLCMSVGVTHLRERYR